MSIFNIFKSQLSSVIEWKDQDDKTLWFKHPSERDEVINASKLIVASGQGCILVYEGKVKDVITDQGIYNLKTDNHPFFTTLGNIRQNFNSEHKLYIYFFRTALVLNNYWGTSSLIKYLDPKYNIPVELGANGSYSYKIANPENFYNYIVANSTKVDAQYIQMTINNDIPQEIISVFSASQLSYNEIDANLSQLSVQIKNAINQAFTNLGLEIFDFKILGTHFDEDTITRIGGIADITSQVQAAGEAGLTYVELEKLRALRDAAQNEGGLAGIGAQLGVGMEIGKQFDLTKESITNELQNASEDYVTKLQKLNLLVKEGILTSEEFETMKKEILSKI